MVAPWYGALFLYSDADLIRQETIDLMYSRLRDVLKVARRKLHLKLETNHNVEGIDLAKRM